LNVDWRFARGPRHSSTRTGRRTRRNCQGHHRTSIPCRPEGRPPEPAWRALWRTRSCRQNIGGIAASIVAHAISNSPLILIVLGLLVGWLTW